LIGGIVFSLQFESVQTWGAKKAANYLSKEWKTKVDIQRLYLKPFKSLVLEGLYIQDLDKDTLLKAPKLLIDISYFAPFSERKITLQNIELDNGKVYLKTYKDSTTNLSFIIDYLNQGPIDTTKKIKPFDITINNVIVRNLDFKYKNYLKKDSIFKNVNYDDLHIMNLNAAINDLDTKNFIFKAQINHLNFREKSGFVLKDLTAATIIDTNKIELKNLFLQTPNTTLTDYFSMKFNNFADLNDLQNKVILEGNFKNSKVYAQDIAFFAPQLKNMNLFFDISGNVKGKVDDLFAKNLIIKTGKATYIKGDFHVKGLPNLEDTYLDLKFDQVYSNKRDIEYIIEKAIGKKSTIIPPILEKFGNINFSGRFNGFQNDFIAYGDFKTKLGRLKTDVNMKINKAGIPSYVGKIQAIDFDLGDLIDEPSLNRTTLTANLNGVGFNINTLSQTIVAKATYFDYNNYRYRNIAINGKIYRQLFDGKLLVNDKNIKLNFVGKANLNPALPEFNFIANFKGANLQQLNFTKDTIQIDADLKTNFTGSNLDNVQGDLAIQQIRLTNTEKSVVVDSVYLKAEGLGKNRLLALYSDIGDARIKGDYDLATLPSAFKTIVKKYIPSYQTTIFTPKSQNFEFNIDLKNFDFISSLFIPDLKIPERGAFNGKFDTKNNIATLNGFIKTIKYQDITFTNIILDENTNAESLEAILSFDKIELSDGGLYIQNVIIQNTLKNDSLSFNVKLSDKDAVNQLDLYGLVQFGTDTLAKLSLLPSDVVIDNQIWKIRDQVRIKFENNRTFIEGFELTSDKQLIAVNGAISSAENDQLELVIEDLKMTSLSQLTKAFGVNLNGTMNGTASLSALLGTPKIQSDITIDSLKYNQTDVGDLKIASTYNNFTSKIDIDAVIFKNGGKTMDVKGNVDFKSDQNNLNLNLILDKTELIIFEPFVKTLVSKLKGQISSGLKVTGKFNKPKIDGNVNLQNAGFTINYLQTAYIINDDFSIDNSVIKVDDLTLNDALGNRAAVNGSVDMENPSNPYIDIRIEAVKLMALNTTRKDNQLYYGKAFGTGTFSFVGPTDAMKINIKAKTEAETEFTIPLNGASVIGADDFIIYVAKDTLLNKKTVDKYFQGLTMEFNLTVDENSIAHILTEVGDLTGTGDAQLNLKITSLGDFEMRGDYIINQGKFDFTANNLINKTFDIRKGGSIRWTGDPTDAAINLNAVYARRVDIKPLYDAAGRALANDAGVQTVLAEAEMQLTNTLLEPEINFELNFPNNTTIKTELQGYLNNKDNTNQQAINLIVRNSFNGNSSAGLGVDQQTLFNSGLELGFSKFNNIISQTLKIKNLDFNLRSFSEFGLGGNFLKGRLKVTGNFINRRSTADDLFNNNIFNSSFNNLALDAQATLDIRKDGSFVGKAFKRAANRDFFNLNSDFYINGIGLVYTQEYDTFDEFLKNTFGRKSKEKEKEESKIRLETKKTPIVKQ
jgi:hypothetical protein